MTNTFTYIYIYVKLNHFAVQQKLTQHYKSAEHQLTKKVVLYEGVLPEIFISLDSSDLKGYLLINVWKKY